ncbi:MAG: tRNA preQ1(34) S-adenosylmethionine ribosyltransferase-isomerase QueA [Aquificae bacterium]|nr:tRNA preQ1(34) S-adenosylmethionine ribosyltransferase-isomerase QueA [Aquificota bacterium]
MYRLSDYDYHLPQELIAKYPVEQRDRCRLMVLDRKKKSIDHRIFKDIESYLQEGDLLVLNDTKVIPARLVGKKETGASIEVFLLNPTQDENVWEVLIKNLKRLKEGNRIIFADDFYAELLEKREDGKAVVKFFGGELKEKIDRYGQIPLPPYIERAPEEKDKEFYQTVFAKKEGAVAAPTAGLHFTNELLDNLKQKGIKIGYITLHVGIGTFKPITTQDITKHKIHQEFYQIPKETVHMIEQTKKRGNSVIAVGTTVVRTLETFARNRKTEGFSSLYIYPPFEFKLVDKLVTNFHLPKSSLLLLVSAFAERQFVLKAYKEAVEKKYRFFSYGDAMFII